MATLGLTIGALEIGVFVSTTLYGVATVQAYWYTQRSFKDSFWLRAMVVFIWLSETILTAFTWVLLYLVTVTNYGVPSAIVDSHWSLGLTVPLSSCVGGSVQSFFGWRVRKLGGSMIIPIFVWVGAVVRLAFGTMVGVVIITSKTIPEFLLRYHWLVDALLALNAAVDILNTSSLCYYLLRKRSDFRGTSRVIDKLIFYAVETGFLTSVCAVGVMVTSIVMPGNYIFISIFVIYPRLFSNSFFTALNTRQDLREKTSKSDGGMAVWSHEAHLGSTQLSDIGSKSVNALRSGHKPPQLHARMGEVQLHKPVSAFADTLITNQTFRVV